jgi:hypothetical protein
MGIRYFFLVAPFLFGSALMQTTKGNAIGSEVTLAVAASTADLIGYH